MKPWIPVVVATLIAIAINVYPAFMAFVIGDRAWAQAGWTLYFLTIPAAIVLVAIGIGVTGWLYNRKNNRKNSKPEST